MNRKITLKQLATISNVSVSTAGRVFSNPSKVSKKTREIVQKNAKELNYRTNLSGRSLKTGKSYEILVMIPFDEFETNILTGIAQYHLTSIISYIFNNSDYQLKILSYTSFEESFNLLKNNLSSRNVDYVILSQMLPQDERVKLLLEYNIPFVTFGKTELLSHYNYFDYDNFSFVYEACTRYINEGYKNPILITSANNYMHYLSQIRAFKISLQEKMIDFNDNMILRIKNNEYNKINDNIVKHDCIITISPSIAYICKNIYKNNNKILGIDVPISCSTPSIELLRLLDIKCTCYFQNFIYAGKVLAEYAISALEDNNKKPLNELETFTVIEL